MPIKVTLRVKRSSLPGQKQGHLLRVAKKQRTEIPNIFIKRETLSTESGNKARNVDKDIAAQSGREKNVTDDLRKSSSCTSHSSNTSRNQCISNATGDECADFIVGTSDGTVISRPNRKIPPMKNSSGSECDEHDNLQKKNEFVSLNFEKAEEEEVVPSSSTHDQSSLTKERLANNTWNTKFEQLQAFKNAQGRTNVPQKSGPLGTWGNDQRRKIRPKWDTRFQELKEFAKANGHANVPPNKLGPLGQWVSNQRTQFRLLKHGKASSMTDERIAKLNGINFQFQRQKQSSKASWDSKFQELKEFTKANGHTNVPQKSGSLGIWVNYQRTQFRLSNEGKVSSTGMTDERLAKLNRINFQFKLNTRTPWDTTFQDLKEFKNAHGHTNVRNRAGPLGIWVSNQRTQFRLFHEGKASSMTDERLAKLNGIKFQFKRQTHPPKASWDTRFQELKEFMKVNGHTNVPEKSGSLGDWVSYQRMQFRLSKEGNASSLINERLAKLNRINFQFNIYSKHP